jgi:hypothetical protein
MIWYDWQHWLLSGDDLRRNINLRRLCQIEDVRRHLMMPSLLKRPALSSNARHESA